MPRLMRSRTVSHCRSPYGERGLKSNGVVAPDVDLVSLPVWGAWIEMRTRSQITCGATRRSPYGERGLKSRGTVHPLGLESSLPVWGAWIEIGRRRSFRPPSSSRSPYGERGLKSSKSLGGRGRGRRSPYGERGLKCDHELRRERLELSLPVWGAWIEISSNGAGTSKR